MNELHQKPIISIQPKWVLYVLTGIGIIIIILSLIGQYLRVFPDSYQIHSPFQDNVIRYFILAFNVNSEANLTTYYSSSMAVLASFLLFIIAFLKNKVSDRYRSHWTILAFFLLYISIDDASIIHEKGTKYLKNLTDAGGWLEYKWVLIGMMVIIIFAVFFLQFWLNLDGKHKALFLLSAVLFFGGAVGMEIIGGRWAHSFGAKNFTYVLLNTFEQALQYAGLITLIYSLLLYMNFHFPLFAVSGNRNFDAQHGIN